MNGSKKMMVSRLILLCMVVMAVYVEQAECWSWNPVQNWKDAKACYNKCYSECRSSGTRGVCRNACLAYCGLPTGTLSDKNT